MSLICGCGAALAADAVSDVCCFDLPGKHVHVIYVNCPYCKNEFNALVELGKGTVLLRPSDGPEGTGRLS